MRQGENLSPFLFSIFLNDLELFLSRKNVSGITCDHDFEETNYYLKLLILLYADDTVIFSNSENGLQHALSMFSEYCNKWRLTVNISKTKVIIFNSRGKPKPTLQFTFNGHNIDIINEYKYLGIYFSQSGAFSSAKKHIS
ncbi:MAG: reverse transcriptase domain-containing protein, partial [Candidatus Thiodiazotropha endolucinida]|nr:reverse transcriptase domain-containing protein [Candidatus Thiodiazotropha endolucinida]